MSVTTSRRAEAKARTREALLSAGVRCFAREGYVGTNVGDVSREARVAHGTFYVHFESKRALLDALLARFNEGLRDELTGALAGDGALLLRVRRAASIFLERCLEHRWLVVAYAERVGAGVTVEELRDGINPQVSERIGALLASVLAPDVDARLVASGLSALWLRVALHVVTAGADVTRAADTLARMTVGALDATSRPGTVGGEP